MERVTDLNSELREVIIMAPTLAFTPYARYVDLRFLRHFVPGQALEKNRHSSVGLQSALL